MNPSDLVNILGSVAGIGQGEYVEAAYIANKTVEYTKQLENKQLSKPEFDDLIQDLKVDQLVARTAEEQQIKITLQSYMQEIMSLAATIALF